MLNILSLLYIILFAASGFSVARLVFPKDRLLKQLMFGLTEKTRSVTPSGGSATSVTSLVTKKNTVGKYVSLLEQKGLIETEPTFFTSKDGKKRNGNLLFRILPIQDVIEARFQRELRKADTARRLQEYDRKHPRKEAT